MAGLFPRRRSADNKQKSPRSRDRSAAPSSRSIAVSTTTERASTPSNGALDTNVLGLEGEDMSKERWTSIAFALGIRAADDYRPSEAAARLARKVSKHKSIPDKQLTELFLTLVGSVAQEHDRLLVKTNAAFSREAVPPDVPRYGIDRRGRIRLPTPVPSIAVGYSPDMFDPHLMELQQGIISDARGEPQDLGRLSQTTPGLFWPFLVIEVNHASMMGARNACAGATASCNNALMMLAGALVDPRIPYDEVFITGLSKAVHSFSLAVNDRTACLMTHNSEPSLAEAVGIVRSYNLDWQKDVDALAARIKSIFVWAENTRLMAIMELLERFDKRVHFKESVRTQESGSRGPMDLNLPGMVSQAARGPSKTQRKSVFKTAVADAMPAWSRVEV